MKYGKRYKMLKECYYFDQTDWKTEDYYTLHMFLMKMVVNYDTTVGSYDGRKRIEEIKSMDLSRMSEESKVLLYCVIQNEGNLICIITLKTAQPWTLLIGKNLDRYVAGADKIVLKIVFIIFDA